jgi:hypothetical protein
MSGNRGQETELRKSSKFKSCATDWFYSLYIEQCEIEKGFGKEIEWNGMEGNDRIFSLLCGRQTPTRFLARVSFPLLEYNCNICCHGFFLDSSVIILLFEDIFTEVCLTSRSNHEWFIRPIPHHCSLTYELNDLKVTTGKHRENESKGRKLLVLHFLSQSCHSENPLFITTF